MVGHSDDFGATLRRFRSERGMSLADLAERTKYSKGYLSKIENSKARGNQRMAEICDEVLLTDGALLRLVDDRTSTPRTGSTGDIGWYLPSRTSHFTGRENEAACVSEWLRRVDPKSSTTTGVCVISGMAGIGKTAFAAHVAEHNHVLFPSGLLFLDLHGYGGMEPVPPASALERLLRRLGVPGGNVPLHIDDRAALLHQHLTEQRLLLILDNVLDTAQVSVLLSAAAEQPVLITSRSSLPALDEAFRLPLAPLPPARAAELVRSLAQDSLSPEVVERTVRRCSGLPLALRILVARARTPDGIVHRADDHDHLDEIEDGERRLEATFSYSLARLSADQQKLFALCGLHPGAEFDSWAVAALAGLDHRAAHRLLRSLWDAGLLLRAGGADRFGFHDLMRLYARRYAAEHLTAKERGAAQVRLVDHYVHSVEQADRVITPHRHRAIASCADHAGRPMPKDYDAAMHWVATELEVLTEISSLAHEQRLDRQCWELAYALRGFLFIVKPRDIWARTHEKALASALRAGDRTAEASVRNNLGLLLSGLGDHETAQSHFLRARQLFHDVGDPYGEHTSLAHAAWVRFQQGDTEAALRESSAALRFFTDHGNERNRAIVQRDTASVEAALGAHHDAVEHLSAALTTFEELGLHVDQAITLNDLADVHRKLGHWETAQKTVNQAIETAMACGSRFEQARAYEHSAWIAAARSAPARADEHADRAVRLYLDIQETERAEAFLHRWQSPLKEPHTPPGFQGVTCPSTKTVTTSSSATPGRTNRQRTSS
ncbi:helix-turn-helix domain-containing protein [Nocardiopsis dassonvillei]|uniref:helix-turn-helix domain-containing protein n=1 Tax=Nocardiopsis dassonvillei TaxID=2014 RepID=UPI00157D7CA9|nr:helix-turn-helix domain-containing protein [Nocardiopsis dassonvillei]